MSFFKMWKASLTATSVSPPLVALLWAWPPQECNGNGGYMNHARGNDFRDFSCISLFILGFNDCSDRSDCQNIGSQLTEAFCKDLIELKDYEFSARPWSKADLATKISKGLSFLKRCHLPTKEDKEVIKGVSFSAPSKVQWLLGGNSGFWKNDYCLGLAATVFLNPEDSGKFHPRWLWFKQTLP